MWFLWATGVTIFRFMALVAYRRRARGSDPDAWARLVVAANLLAGIQWGMLGALLFPEQSGYRQLFTIMVITCFVGGSLPAYASVKGAHEALAVPATLPTAFNLFFVQQGIHWFAGLTALFFCFAIVYYARKLSRHIEDRFRLQIERDDLLELTALLNEKLERETGSSLTGRRCAEFRWRAHGIAPAASRRCSNIRRCPSSNAMARARSLP